MKARFASLVVVALIVAAVFGYVAIIVKAEHRVKIQWVDGHKFIVLDGYNKRGFSHHPDCPCGKGGK
jgi:hypothetical protein